MTPTELQEPITPTQLAELARVLQVIEHETPQAYKTGRRLIFQFAQQQLNPLPKVDDNLMSRIVETDNFGGDYPDESFLPIPDLPKDKCEAIAKLLNDSQLMNSQRYWKVVEPDYKLLPGFEP